MADLDALLHELRSLGDPIPQARVMALLRSFTGQRIYFARSALVKPERRRLAASMLAVGMPQADVARALVERLQVSEATAYRIIAEARTERHGGRQLELLR